MKKALTVFSMRIFDLKIPRYNYTVDLVPRDGMSGMDKVKFNFFFTAPICAIVTSKSDIILKE